MGKSPHKEMLAEALRKQPATLNHLKIRPDMLHNSRVASRAKLLAEFNGGKTAQRAPLPSH